MHQAHNQEVGNRTIAPPEILKTMFSCLGQQQVTTYHLVVSLQSIVSVTEKYENFGYGQ